MYNSWYDQYLQHASAIVNIPNNWMNIKYSFCSFICKISLLLRFKRYTICCIFASTTIDKILKMHIFFGEKSKFSNKINLCVNFTIVYNLTDQFHDGFHTRSFSILPFSIFSYCSYQNENFTIHPRTWSLNTIWWPIV